MQIDLKVERDNVILVYSSGCLHAISSVDGAVLWNMELERLVNLPILVSVPQLS